MNHHIHIEIALPALPKQVMHMLTQHKEVALWTGENCVFEAREGGNIEMFDGWMSGKVLRLSESELHYTWRTNEWDSSVADSEVKMVLKKDGDHTHLVLDQTGLPDENERDSQHSFWIELFFTPLEDYLMVRFHRD
ncbi:MAG: SRPBCC domain-containing protein [Chitinophagaceae bacterium]